MDPPLFFFINSQPRIPDSAQVEIYPDECSALTHKSYVDLSGAKTFQPDELLTLIDRGFVSKPALARIKETLVSDAPTLVERHRKLAMQNLGLT